MSYPLRKFVLHKSGGVKTFLIPKCFFYPSSTVVAKGFNLGSSHIEIYRWRDESNTVEAAYMGRLGTGYYCLLHQLSLLSVVQ